MKHKLLSLGLTLALCLGLTIPAAAAEQIITVGDETYDRVMAPLLAMEADEPVTLVLGSDIQLTGYSVVLGTSDYGGMFEEPVTIVSHDVTIDLNGYTITGEEGYALFEVQDGYTLTIVDNSEAKTGALVTQGDANEDPDGEITFDRIVGKMDFSIPYLGYISLNIRTPIGIVSICGVLVLIILLTFIPEIFSKDDEEEKKENEEKAEKQDKPADEKPE